MLRLQVDTVGQVGKPGEHIQNVISVGMLSEGWDAKTCHPHHGPARLFPASCCVSRWLGRGLRRTSYETKTQTDPVTGEEIELFEPEYVNIFGVPFTFLPHEAQEKRPATTAGAEDGCRAGGGQGWLRDCLAEYHPHRPCVPTPPAPRLGASATLASQRRPNSADCRVGSDCLTASRT